MKIRREQENLHAGIRLAKFFKCDGARLRCGAANGEAGTRAFHDRRSVRQEFGGLYFEVAPLEKCTEIGQEIAGAVNTDDLFLRGHSS